MFAGVMVEVLEERSRSLVCCTAWSKRCMSTSLFQDSLSRVRIEDLRLTLSLPDTIICTLFVQSGTYCYESYKSQLVCLIIISAREIAF